MNSGSSDVPILTRKRLEQRNSRSSIRNESSGPYSNSTRFQVEPLSVTSQIRNGKEESKRGIWRKLPDQQPYTMNTETSKESHSEYLPSYHTPMKKSSKIVGLIPNINNTHKGYGMSSVSVKNKYGSKNLPALPISNLTSKKIYKCSEMSSGQHGKVFAYGLYSTQGSVRPYNEDRVVEFHTVLKSEVGMDVNFSFFGIYDGHGGQQCSKYLSKEFHMALIDDPLLLKNPSVTIKKHINDMDSQFLKLFTESPTNTELQRAGSCLNAVVILDEMCYVVNVGDSRSIMSSHGGKLIREKLILNPIWGLKGE